LHLTFQWRSLFTQSLHTLRHSYATHFVTGCDLLMWILRNEGPMPLADRTVFNLVSSIFPAPFCDLIDRVLLTLLQHERRAPLWLSNHLSPIAFSAK
jgi:hypothetical protein